MAKVTEAKFLLMPGWEKQFMALPGVNAAVGGIARTVTERMKSNVTGPGTSAFKRRAFTEPDPEQPGTWHAGTQYRIAHIFEFGSVNTSPHGWLRRAAASTPSTRFVPSR